MKKKKKKTQKTDEANQNRLIMIGWGGELVSSFL